MIIIRRDEPRIIVRGEMPREWEWASAARVSAATAATSILERFDPRWRVSQKAEEQSFERFVEWPPAQLEREIEKIRGKLHQMLEQALRPGDSGYRHQFRAIRYYKAKLSALERARATQEAIRARFRPFYEARLAPQTTPPTGNPEGDRASQQNRAEASAEESTVSQSNVFVMPLASADSAQQTPSPICGANEEAERKAVLDTCKTLITDKLTWKVIKEIIAREAFPDSKNPINLLYKWLQAATGYSADNDRQVRKAIAKALANKSWLTEQIYPSDSRAAR